MRILYIDDNAVDRVVAKRLAMVLGFDLDVAASATEGITLFEGNAYDGLVVDLILPERSGLDVLHHVRAASGRPRMPLIILTAAATPEVEAQCRAADADSVLFKPFLFSDVLRIFGEIPRQAEDHVRVA